MYKVNGEGREKSDGGGGRERKCERTIKRREGKEGKDSRARARDRDIELILEERERNIEEG